VGRAHGPLSRVYRITRIFLVFLECPQTLRAILPQPFSPTAGCSPLGGEYNSTIANADILAVQIYDPVADAWTSLASPSGWSGIGDAPSCVLSDGRFLLGSYNSAKVAIYDAGKNTWVATSAKGDRCSEETFTLLPDGTVLTVQCSNAQNAEKYLPATEQWVSAGATPSALPQPCLGLGAEIGPAILLPEGRVFAISASGNTALYTPPSAALGVSSPGTWTAEPPVADSNAVFDHVNQKIAAGKRASIWRILLHSLNGRRNAIKLAVYPNAIRRLRREGKRCSSAA